MFFQGRQKNTSMNCEHCSVLLDHIVEQDLFGFLSDYPSDLLKSFKKLKQHNLRPIRFCPFVCCLTGLTFLKLMKLWRKYRKCNRCNARIIFALGKVTSCYTAVKDFYMKP